MRHCPQCGHEVADEALFCQTCGNRLAEGAAEASNTGASAAPYASPRERLAPGQRDGKGGEEEVLWEGTFSGKAMLGSWALALLLTAAAIVAAVMLPETVAFRALGATIVVLLAWGIPLVRLGYRKLSIRYRATNHRLFHEEGILWRTTNRVEMIDADDVTVQQSIFDRIMNVGTVRIESSDRTHPELYLIGIDAPLEVAEKIDAARRRERTRRGVHIEAV
jgi:membrane protein YdbS with pleckstrin-like domain